MGDAVLGLARRPGAARPIAGAPGRGADRAARRQRNLAGFVGIGVLAGLVFLIQNAFGDARPIHLQTATTSQVGVSLFRNFVLPFEVVSVLLLAALIGAVVIARKDEYE